MKVPHYLVVSVSPDLCTGAVPDIDGQLLVSQMPSLSCRRNRSQTWVSVPPQFIFQINIPHQSRREATIFKFSTIWFLLLTGTLIKQKVSVLSWFSKSVLQFYALHVLWIISVLCFSTLRCNSESLQLCHFHHLRHLYFSFLPNQRVQRARLTSYAFLHLISLGSHL